MPRILSTAVAALLIVGTIAMPTEFVNDEDNTVPVKTVAQFTEGFLYGILHHEVPAVDACITNVNAIWIHVTNAMTDFNKKSFDGVSSGLSELSEGVKEIPTAIEHCV